MVSTSTLLGHATFKVTSAEDGKCKRCAHQSIPEETRVFAPEAYFVSGGGHGNIKQQPKEARGFRCNAALLLLCI